MKMDINYLKRIIKLLDSSGVAELEIEEEGTRLRLSKPRPKLAAGIAPLSIAPQQIPQTVITEAPAKAIEPETKGTITTDEPKSENIFEVKSPMVGTFYRAPSPDADPYVAVGSTVNPGTVLCIIEAMKLMNEIESEVPGKIVKILVENAQPVEYNQPLFHIEKF
jgi:acetyl-CoA carboxylase biotin carboxyl carrier protein